MAATEHPIESTFLLGRLTLDKLPLETAIALLHAEGALAVLAIAAHIRKRSYGNRSV